MVAVYLGLISYQDGQGIDAAVLTWAAVMLVPAVLLAAAAVLTPRRARLALMCTALGWLLVLAFLAMFTIGMGFAAVAVVALLAALFDSGAAHQVRAAP